MKPLNESIKILHCVKIICCTSIPHFPNTFNNHFAMKTYRAIKYLLTFYSPNSLDQIVSQNMFFYGKFIAKLSILYASKRAVTISFNLKVFTSE